MSENLKCAMIYRSELNNEEVALVDFNTPITATIRIQNLLAAPLNISLNKILSKPLVLSDDCKSFSVENDPYHTTDYVTYSKDTILTNTNVYSFTRDLHYALGKYSGLMKYEVNGTYTNITSFDKSSMLSESRKTLYNKNVLVLFTPYYFTSSNYWYYYVSRFSQVTYKSHGYNAYSHYSIA
jgi:hypothetical protein